MAKKNSSKALRLDAGSQNVRNCIFQRFHMRKDNCESLWGYFVVFSLIVQYNENSDDR